MSHIHTLRRVGKKKELFMCADPTCTWTRRKEFLIGKKFICPLCGKEYLTDAEALRRKLPHCKDCTASKAASLQLALPNLTETQDATSITTEA